MISTKHAPEQKPGYNERLFKSGLRARLHMARFLWVQETLQSRGLKPERVLELGSFDGRAIEYLPRIPSRYLGLDAGWENAFAHAHARWKNHPQLEFRKCRKPEEMKLLDETYDLALALETLEHIPAQDVEGYLQNIAGALRPEGCFLVTVPNEIGPVFAAKHLAKVMVVGGHEPYSFQEFVFQTIGKVNKVNRLEHKGFHYRHMITTIKKYFTVDKVEGLPFSALPPYFNFGIGIVCRPKAD